MVQAAALGRARLVERWPRGAGLLDLAGLGTLATPLLPSALGASRRVTDFVVSAVASVQRLQSGARYIVAIRNLATQSTGEPLAPSPAFQALRDSTQQSSNLSIAWMLRRDPEDTDGTTVVVEQTPTRPIPTCTCDRRTLRTSLRTSSRPESRAPTCRYAPGCTRASLPAGRSSRHVFRC